MKKTLLLLILLALALLVFVLETDMHLVTEWYDGYPVPVRFKIWSGGQFWIWKFYGELGGLSFLASRGESRAANDTYR